MPDEGVLTVVCNGCGATGELLPGQGANPFAAVACVPGTDCCQEPPPHSHAGETCGRAVTIYASAALAAEMGA